jgi:hypothetical protein
MYSEDETVSRMYQRIKLNRPNTSVSLRKKKCAHLLVQSFFIQNTSAFFLLS